MATLPQSAYVISPPTGARPSTLTSTPSPPAAAAMSCAQSASVEGGSCGRSRPWRGLDPTATRGWGWASCRHGRPARRRWRSPRGRATPPVGLPTVGPPASISSLPAGPAHERSMSAEGLGASGVNGSVAAGDEEPAASCAPRRQATREAQPQSPWSRGGRGGRAAAAHVAGELHGATFGMKSQSMARLSMGHQRQVRAPGSRSWGAAIGSSGVHVG